MLLRNKAVEMYPEFKNYLYYRFPKVIASSRIVSEMEINGNLNESQFRAALHPGSHPVVDIEEVSADPATYYSCELGHISGGIISLYSPVVAAFNEGPWYNQNYFKNAKGQDVPVIGAVLLHFLCHWGWLETKTLSYSSTDVGYDFEKLVYGRRARFRLFTTMTS